MQKISNLSYSSPWSYQSDFSCTEQDISIHANLFGMDSINPRLKHKITS